MRKISEKTINSSELQPLETLICLDEMTSL